MSEKKSLKVAKGLENAVDRKAAANVKRLVGRLTEPIFSVTFAANDIYNAIIEFNDILEDSSL